MAKVFVRNGDVVCWDSGEVYCKEYLDGLVDAIRKLGFPSAKIFSVRGRRDMSEVLITISVKAEDWCRGE